MGPGGPSATIIGPTLRPELPAGTWSIKVQFVSANCQ